MIFAGGGGVGGKGEALNGVLIEVAARIVHPKKKQKKKPPVGILSPVALQTCGCVSLAVCVCVCVYRRAQSSVANIIGQTTKQTASERARLCALFVARPKTFFQRAAAAASVIF